MYTSEIQQHLLLDGISPPCNLPSQCAIKKCILKDCKMTKKKVSLVPQSTPLSQANTDYTDYFLDQIGHDHTKLHFLTNVVLL